MYKETVKPAGKTILFIIGIIGGALVLMSVVDVLVEKFNLPYKSVYQLAAVVMVAVGCYIFLRNVISKYEYCVVDNELIITSTLGGNERLIARIYIDEIKLIAFHKSQSQKNIKCAGKYNAKKSFVQMRTYICIFKQDGKLYKMKFEPSDKLLEILGKKGVNIENHTI